MKSLLIVVGVVILGIGGYFLLSRDNTTSDMMSDAESEKTEMVTETEATQMSSDMMVPTNGVYVVVPEASTVAWAGKKPFIDGYINSGSIAVEQGSITVADASATGEFTIDMQTLSVSETPTKPGQESTLEGHLKGDRWFNVAEYPTATFVITDIAQRADSEITHKYDVTGELTMKGTSGELAFPATIYMDETGMLQAEASFEFDRTKWGITAGSGSFFDNLADNVIDDMVSLSFVLVAEQQ